MNKKPSMFLKKVTAFVIVFTIFVGIPTATKAKDITFTDEELKYLANAQVLKAASIDGAAPLHYKNSKGEIKGIGIDVLEEISSITGLSFDYYLYESISKANNDNIDIYFGISKEYALPRIILSNSYLESETVLFYNKSLDASDLENKKYAAVKCGTLPDGITEDKAIYFNDREETINAVEKGRADYGYGNAYSIAFYTLQNDCNNIVTIPTGKEMRNYCIGVSEDDEILLSIINKAIDSIDKSKIDSIVLDVASQIERKITLEMIVGAYGHILFAGILLIILVLIFSVYSISRSKSRYKLENKRYRLLSQLSNEYLFEYEIKKDKLDISDNLKSKIDVEKSIEKICNLINDYVNDLKEHANGENIHTIELPLINEDIGIFKMYFSYLWDESGKIHSVIGKLVDISDEEKEKQLLIAKSQSDGLTGLYNASTTKDSIEKLMAGKKTYSLDALIVIDCDRFKDINDNYGHLKGDLALEYISKGLKLTFRQSDIVGRVGGDEFCVYMQNIPTVDFVLMKCQQLTRNINELSKQFLISISIGIATYKEQITYEELFKQADDALYLAKKKGGSQISIAGESELIKIEFE